MPLVTLKNLSHSFGDVPVLDHAELTIDAGERICLVGRNGEGKSTLLRLLAKQILPDEGDVIYTRDVVVTELRQDVPTSIAGSVYDVVGEGIGTLGKVITDWHHATLQAATDPDALKRMEVLQHEIESQNGWNLEQRISATISQLKLPADEPFDNLSGGLKRRCLLAQALVAKPDLLLLDEPTNHLDIDSILWLEEFLKSFNGSILFITHDRSFLHNLATRIIDLDRGRLTSWPGNYQKYLEAKQRQLDAEATANALFDKKLAQEEAWIRQGIKARRTRNEGRVRALEKMRVERGQRRETVSKARLTSQQAEQSGKIVIEADGLAYAWQDQTVFENFSCCIQRGDKIGIIGPNGCGKSTLIQVLLGKLPPGQGRIKTGTRLEIAYFDQNRESIDPEKSVRDHIADGSDKVEINGSSRHVIGYLKDFLFTARAANAPAGILSGGERNRLMLARLFTRPFNFLIMDEPTNDLDLETLELLEERLLDFDGTLLLVSHDRSFIDHVVDYCFVFEGNGQINTYIGGYQDWLRQRPAVEPAVIEKPATAHERKDKRPAKKLGYNEQKELKSLPAKIEKLEQRISTLQQGMSASDFYRQDADAIADARTELESLEEQLGQLYERWEQLENLT